MSLRFSLWAALLVGEAPLLAQDNQSRREFATPGLVVETGYRTGACDVLTFTGDGKFLLAAGDDKVVRTWRFTGKSLQKIPEPAPTGTPLSVLRWPSFREMKGNIYALAFSPDGNKVAVAGYGLRDSQTAVLDRFSGAIVHILPVLPSETNVHIRSIAYSPNGKQVAIGAGDGSVWVWDLPNGNGKGGNGAGAARLLGRHPKAYEPKKDEQYFNWVYALAYLDNERLISADRHGSVLQWGAQQRNGQSGKEIFHFKLKGHDQVRRYAFSADHQRLAAIFPGSVQVITIPAGSLETDCRLAGDQIPSHVAFDREGKRLAVAVSKVDQKGEFQKEIDFPVYLIPRGGKSLGNPILEGTHRIEGLSFHPDGKFLAMAGGKNHEVTLWSLNGGRSKLVSNMESPGECIWQVGLANGRYLGYKTEPARDPPHVNQLGKGSWKVFDLERRVFATDREASFTAEPPAGAAQAWKVVTRNRDAEVKAAQWYVQKNGGALQPIPWDYNREGLPRCYAFVPGRNPPVLAVGGFNSVNVFELSTSGVRRTRYLTGHDGEIMSLAVSKDGKHMVTGSRDQTIAGWSLDDWPSHPQLGAQFFVKEGRLLVGKVDNGSPVWEAGLSTGDEIVLLVVAGRNIVYNNRSGKKNNAGNEYPQAGTAEKALEALQKPEAGLQLYFGWRRPGKAALVENLTTLRERPIWRFFPTREREWVLWRWQDFYYDTSTRGDSYVGWHVNFWQAEKNTYDVSQPPRFFQAEQFRGMYHDPRKIAATLRAGDRPALVQGEFTLFEPPSVEAKVDAGTAATKNIVKDADVSLNVRVVPNSGRENQQLKGVLVWINDFQFQRFEGDELEKCLSVEKDAAGQKRGVFTLPNLRIPRAMLRSGPNSILVQAFNKADTRGDCTPILLTHDVPRANAKLHGLFIGVSDYTKTKPRIADLGAAEDAKMLESKWPDFLGKLYAKGDFRSMVDQQVTRPAVLAQLEVLARKVRPDDLLVFHLGGHGATPEVLFELDKLRAKGVDKLGAKDRVYFDATLAKLSKQGLNPNTFLFVTSKFDGDRLSDTTIRLDDFYERLIKLPCHKLILLDACHSGAAAADPTNNDLVRSFTRNKVGPIILAACRPEETALEFGGLYTGGIANGLFAQAILQVVDKDFAAADTNKNGLLEPDELHARILYQIPKWIDLLPGGGKTKMRQSPVLWVPALERSLAIVSTRSEK